MVVMRLEDPQFCNIRGQEKVSQQRAINENRSMVNSRDDAWNGNENSNHWFIPYGTAWCEPAQSHNGTCFHMANNGAGHRTCLGDDKKLWHVDYAGEHARLVFESMSAKLCIHEVAFLVTAQRWGNGREGVRTIIIMTHLLIGTSLQTGNVSTNGIT